MRISLIVLIACTLTSLNAALEFTSLHMPLIKTAYSFDEEAYTELHPKQKEEYEEIIARALHLGKITPQDIIDHASPSLRYGVARCYYLLYGRVLDLQNDKISFPLRILIKHDRLGRAISENGELDLSYLHIADLDGIEEIPSIKSVHSLNLSHNEISLLHINNFNALSHLKNLDLSFNHLSSIKAKTFSHLTHLHTLNLSHNVMPHFDKNSCFNLHALEELNISYNKLEWLGFGAFNDLHHLKNLDISNNVLPTINVDVFDPLTHLIKLNLSHNKLTLLPAKKKSGTKNRAHAQNVFHALHHLEHLDLSNNKLTIITSETLHGLEQLQMLNLRNNQLHAITIMDKQITPHLKIINVSNNHRNMHVSVFTERKNIKT